MKKTVSKILSFMMVFAVAFSMIIIPQTAIVNADSDDWGTTVNYAKKVTLATGNYNVDFGKRYNSEKDKIRVTTNNKKVAAVDKTTETFKLKKPGTAVIKFVITKKSGAKKTYTMNVKCVKYQNPFKSIKFAGKEYKSKFKKEVSYELEKNPGKYKVAVKPAKGWKVESITHTYFGTDEDGETDFDNLIEKKVKNNGKISITKDRVVSYLSIVMFNKKTGCKELIEFSITGVCEIKSVNSSLW